MEQDVAVKLCQVEAGKDPHAQEQRAGFAEWMRLRGHFISSKPDWNKLEGILAEFFR
jgi:hypothetical protein